MTRMKALNIIVSTAVILQFFIEFILLLLTDFSQNLGASKNVTLFYFIICYIWLILPASLSLLFHKRIAKSKIILIIAIILNGFIFINGLSMLNSYISSFFR